jgi:hypothetical protein
LPWLIQGKPLKAEFSRTASLMAGDNLKHFSERIAFSVGFQLFLRILSAFQPDGRQGLSAKAESKQWSGFESERKSMSFQEFLSPESVFPDG